MYLTQGLHRAVQWHPDETMTIDGTRTHSFAEVADRVARLAGALRARGVGRGDRVAMLALNSDRYTEYLLAVPWADAVLNPLNTRWSATELSYALRDSSTRVLLVDDAFLPMLAELQAGVPELDTVIHFGDKPTPAGAVGYERLIAATEPIEDSHRGGSELAGLFYTGGTTGSPKGVMLSHENLVVSWLGAAASRCWGGGPDAVSLHVAPMFHLADISSWGVTLLSGGAHVSLPRFDPVAVFEAVSRHHVTEMLLVPTMIQILVDHPEAASYDLSSLKTLLYGASPIPKAVLERAMKVLPNTSFTQAFGMTELSPIATLLTPEDHRRGLLRSAGRAAPHAEIRIVDDEGRELPQGSIGEIAARGGNVMLGYWNQPEATAAALRDGWMHTGDAGYLDEHGYLYVVDRLKDMIVTGGENVYSAEVENAIAHHPAVAQCAVIGVPSPKWGEQVHAVVVLQPQATLTLEELRAHVKTFIAGYKAPRSLETVDALPTSGAGKILKRDLRQRFWAEHELRIN